MSDDKRRNNRSHSTYLSHGARNSKRFDGLINIPPTRASTIEFDTLADMDAGTRPHGYGRVSTPIGSALQDMVSTLEGGAITRLAPSGIAALAVAIQTVCRAGDELLIVDCVYDPTRRFVSNLMVQFGVTPIFFDPRIGGEIADLITDKTAAIILESPGSLTMEVQDMPAMRAACAQKDIAIICDNSWATPINYQPLSLGADMVVHSATKYFSGHSDVCMGTLTANEKWADRMRDTHRIMGQTASPDDIYLVLRGMRTLATRMKQHERSALEIAHWLGGQKGVQEVLHPALKTHPDNGIFERDFLGSTSLFSVLLQPGPRDAVAKMVDELRYFALGYSYGGFESLVIAPRVDKIRTAVPYREDGNLLRFHIGLEDVNDLKDDLQAGLARYCAAIGI